MAATALHLHYAWPTNKKKNSYNKTLISELIESHTSFDYVSFSEKIVRALVVSWIVDFSSEDNNKNDNTLHD